MQLSGTSAHVPIRKAKHRRKRPAKRRRRRHRKYQAMFGNKLQESNKRDNMENLGDSKIIGYYKCKNSECSCKLKIQEILNFETLLT